jgi:tripartite-type tricarboxylate transporter receptor subunit TctC
VPALARRRFLHAAVAAAIAAAVDQSRAQNYPAKRIQLIVPLAAGSTADIACRFVATELTRALGQAVVVVNVPGAGGAIGTAQLARAAPDGYTIGFVSQGTLVFNQGLYVKPGYDSARDFAPLALLGRAPNVMVVHPSNPALSVTDVIADARAKPRESTFASGGSGTSHHISGVIFARTTGTDLLHVPYRSAPQGVQAVVSKEVTMGFFNTPMVLGLIRDGKLKALGITSRTRSPLLPDVPTLNEQGVTTFEVDAWAGFVAPAATPPVIVERLNSELNRILDSARARATLVSQGFDLAPPATPSAFAALVAADLERWIPMVKALGAKPE